MCGETMKRLGSYFTVEAAMILPLVISIMTIMILAFIYQYDRCLMEQDVNMILIYSLAECANGKEAAEDAVRRKVQSMNINKYVAWEQDRFDIKIRGDNIEMEAEGRMPLNPVKSWGDKMSFISGIKRKSIALNPGMYLRTHKRIKGVIDNANRIY